MIRKERNEIGRRIEDLKRSEYEAERVRAELGESGRMKQKIEQYSKQIAQDPANTHALVGRAQVYERMGLRDKATADLRMACRLDPDNRDLREMYRVVKAQPGRDG